MKKDRKKDVKKERRRRRKKKERRRKKKNNNWDDCSYSTTKDPRTEKLVSYEWRSRSRIRRMWNRV